MRNPRRTLSKETAVDDGDPGPSVRRHHVKRRRSDGRETSPPATKVSKRSKQDKRRGTDVPDEDKLFACPLAKGAPDVWATIDDCLAWRNKNIGTVIRHHILTKHKDLNDSFSQDDPRRIDPARFAQLQKWKDDIRLEKRKGADFWTTVYTILFNIPKSERDSIPSPYFSPDTAQTVVRQINARLHDRAIDDPGFVNHDASVMLLRTKRREAQRDVEKGFVREHFGMRIRHLKALRETELRRVDERCEEDVGSYQKQFMNELTAPQRSNSDNDVSYVGTSPLQSMNTQIGMGKGWSIESTHTELHPTLPSADVATGLVLEAAAPGFTLTSPPRSRAHMHLSRAARGKLPVANVKVTSQSSPSQTRQRSRHFPGGSHFPGPPFAPELDELFGPVPEMANNFGYDPMMMTFEEPAQHWATTPERDFSP